MGTRAIGGACPYKKGLIIGAHDLQIAATALSLGYSLATLNRDEFSRVPGLELVEIGT